MSTDPLYEGLSIVKLSFHKDLEPRVRDMIALIGTLDGE